MKSGICLVRNWNLIRYRVLASSHGAIARGSSGRSRVA